MGVSPMVRAILCIEAVVLMLLGIVVADQMAHKRVETLAGVNSWGYRGPVAAMQRGAEVRVAVVGGDRAFGWGVQPDQTMAAYLRTEVERRLLGAAVTVVNLGAIGLPAAAYADRIESFASLAPDIVCVYLDLIDRSPAALLPRHDSAITATTGYVPMLPLLLRDKGRALDANGRRWLGWWASTTSAALTAIDRVAYRWLGFAPAPATTDRDASLNRAVDAALAAAPAVVVVLPMPLSEAEQRAHEAARQALAARSAGEPRLSVVDLREVPALADPALRLDGFNYGAAGHSLAATAVAPAVADFARSRPKL